MSPRPVPAPALTERLLVLAAADAAALGAVRALPGLRVARADANGPADAPRLWLRGLPPTGALPLALRQLPALAAYGLDARGFLFPPGRPTPTGQLPTGLAWQPLAEFVPLAVPTAALPGQAPAAFCPPLLPSAQPEEAAGVLTTLAA